MKNPPYLLPILAASAVAALAGVRAFWPRRLRPGQVVVITGGSRGLGFAVASAFGRAGLKLVLAARNPEELEKARTKLLAVVAHPEDVLVVPADLTDPAQAQHLIDATIAHFGRIDVLVNNAGIIEVGPVENQPLAAYERAMKTNFFAALYTTLAALPHLIKQPGGHRAIVNISSIGGKIAVPHLLPYVAAKFALTGFSEGLHAELRFKDVRVTTVCPGLMRTGGEVNAVFTGQQEKEKVWFNLGAKTPGVAASVEGAAAKILRAVQAGRAEITITPQAWLAARGGGLAPETTQFFNAVLNELVLPAPAPQP
jgi:NAD(P)-dependent dehydrogenase (short-subunit alcohol dehydrogenase family)